MKLGAQDSDITIRKADAFFSQPFCIRLAEGAESLQGGCHLSRRHSVEFRHSRGSGLPELFRKVQNTVLI